MKLLLAACLFAMTLATQAKADGVTLTTGGTDDGAGSLEITNGYTGAATISGGTLVINGNSGLNGSLIGVGVDPILGTLTLSPTSPGSIPLGTFTLSNTGGDLPTLFDVSGLTLTLDGGLLTLYSPEATFTDGTQPGLYTVAFSASPEPPTLFMICGAGVALALVMTRRRLVRAA
jgi:autotransporter-associated beta strand protein